MKKKNINKSCVIGMIFLVLGMNIIPITTSNSEIRKSTLPILEGDTIYVGGSGPGNFSKIQDAINNASNGDTVFVFSGTYNENPYVNKSIELIGENKNSTIIKGFKIDDVIKIVNSWVSVQNFYINNSGPFGTHSGIKINGEIHNVSIKNNIITDNLIGICIGDEYSSYIVKHTRIEGNLIKNNTFGLTLYVSYYTMISNNTFIGNGIVIPEAYTRFNTVINNTVNGLPLIYLTEQSNKVIEESAGQIILKSCENITITSQEYRKHCDIFIELIGCSNCKIINNKISWKYYCVYSINSNNNLIKDNLFENVSYGVYLLNSDENTISFNKVNNCRYSVLSRKSDSNTISHNFFSNCYDGLYLLYSNHNIISFNLIDNCSNNGIELFYSCNFNKFLNNTINNSRYKGIYLLGSTQIWWDTASNKNLISGNNIENNSIGIFLEDASLTTVSMNNIVRNFIGIDVASSCFSKIFNNNIYDNEKEDALLKNSFTTRFRGNFWNEKIRLHIIKGGFYRYDFWGESYVLIFPLPRFDWHPAQEPYDIGV